MKDMILKEKDALQVSGVISQLMTSVVLIYHPARIIFPEQFLEKPILYGKMISFTCKSFCSSEIGILSLALAAFRVFAGFFQNAR